MLLGLWGLQVVWLCWHFAPEAADLARRLTRASFPEIGRSFGGKDHSTVVKGVKKIEEMLRDNPDLAELVRSTERLLTEGGVSGAARLKDGGV